MSVPTLRMNNGNEIPQLGFGVFQIPPDEVVAPVAAALDSGYRLIDTAAAYGNEEGVGKAIADSGIPREELFITTKLWNTDQGYDETLRAFDSSIGKLGLDYVDLYLIHWPTPKRDRYLDTWRAFEKIYAEGRTKAIGVSNFHTNHLNRLADNSDITPAVNQVELHPGLPQTELRDYHREHGILTESWSPIGQGQGLLDDAEIKRVADLVGKTPAQVVLRWHIQHGLVVIPKSANPDRIKQNIDVFDFELDAEAMAALDGYGTGNDRIGPDPDSFNLA